MEHRYIYQTPHYVFDSMGEFREHFNGNTPSVILNWREGKQGDWVLTDDGRILQLLKVAPFLSHPRDKDSKRTHQRGWVRTIVGTFIADDKVKMDSDFSKHANRYTFGKNGTKNFRKKCLRRFVAYYIMTGDPYEAYKKTFPKAVNHFYIENRINALLSRGEVIKLMQQQIDDAARELGLDLKYLFRKLMGICDRKDAQDKDIIAAVRELKDMMGVGTKESGLVNPGDGGYYELLNTKRRQLPSIDDARILPEPVKNVYLEENHASEISSTEESGSNGFSRQEG